MSVTTFPRLQLFDLLFDLFSVGYNFVGYNFWKNCNRQNRQHHSEKAENRGASMGYNFSTGKILKENLSIGLFTTKSCNRVTDVVEVLRKGGADVLVRYNGEEWKRYKQWLVGRNGLVKNVFTGKIIQQEYNTRGYLRVTIDKRWLAHRLVMNVWRGGSELEVDHINGIRDDNRLENLEYVTREENERRKKQRPMIIRPSTSEEYCPF